MRRLLVPGLVVLSMAAAHAASAAEVVVEMLSRDAATNTNNLFKPGLIRINKGDTVKWVAKQSGHNVAFVEGAVPAGVAIFTSQAGKDASFKFDKPGVYLYKCAPHVGLGMVGLVVVGNNKSNLAAVKAAYIPPLSKKRLEPFFKELDKP
ncbi:MAG: pseudoazurin [Micropepsaceae bacterium]